MKKAQNMPYQSRTLGAEAWYRFKKNKLYSYHLDVCTRTGNGHIIFSFFWR